jgi:hypothetical protein
MRANWRYKDMSEIPVNSSSTSLTGGPISFDLETWLIARARLAPPIVCGAWADGYTSQIWRASEPEFTERVRSMLLGSRPIIGCFIAFDMACLCAHDSELTPLVFEAYRAGKVHDILLREKIIAIAQGAESEREPGLGSVAATRGLRINKDTSWRMEYSRLAAVPVEHWPEEAKEYLLADVSVPLEIWKLQEEDSDAWGKTFGAGLFALSDEEAFSSFCLYLQSAWGVKTDRRRVCALIKETRSHLSEARARLVEIGLVRDETKLGRTGRVVRDPLAGTRDTKAARSLALGAYKKEGIPPKLTEKGAICLDEDSCLLTGDPDLAAYAEYCSESRTETLLDDLSAGFELPLQTRFNSLVDTYRTSSRKPSHPVRGMQMQNFATSGDTRACFEPREGYVFIQCDVSSMEAHYWAQFCSDMEFGDTLLRDLNSGADIHRALAAETYGIPVAEVSDEQRSWAKPGNYGFMGGMGEATFCLTQRKNTGKPFPAELAVALRAAWKRLRPETGPFFAYVQKLCTKGRDDKGTLQHPSTGAWRTAHYCSLANFTFQHPSAIGVKRGMQLVQQACYAKPGSPLYGCRPWNMIHDEIVAEAPIDQASEAADEMGKLLAQGCNTLLPDCPTKAPALVCATWSKKHKPKRDSAGKLVLSD